MAYGTYSTLDSLQAQFAGQATVLQVGEQALYAEIEKLIAIHNDLVSEQLSILAEFSTERITVLGAGTDSMIMEEIDQFGTPDAQKVSVPGGNMGFPLRKYSGSLQWTRAYLQIATVGEVAKDLRAMQDADTLVIQRELRNAFFRPTNYVWDDMWVDHYDLNVKALVNADSMYVPMNPLTGETFNAATHTHYMGRIGGAVAAADLTALISNVREHFGGTINLVVYIPQSLEQTVRGFAGFLPYPDPRVALPNTVEQLTPGYSRPLDLYNLNNRAIGVFDVAEIWVKPWVPSQYMLCVNLSGPKTLRVRTRANGGGNLALAFEDENHPLRAKTYEREFGIAVQSRTSAAVLYTGNTVYTSPY